MPTVQRDDAEVAYTVKGDGPGLILVHGTAASGTTTWAPILRAVAKDRTVLLPDLRGSGATRDGGEPLVLETMADDVLAVATDAGLDDFDLVGFSLGGAVAACAAARAPRRVRSLVVIATPLAGTDSRSRLQFGIWKDLYAADPALFARYWLLAGLSPGFVAAIPADELALAATFPIEAGLERQCTLNTELDLTALARAIAAPTLVVGCTADTVVPPAEVQRLAGAIPAAEYRAIDSGHMAILETPALLAHTILRHIAQ
jgi:3-oxoadipate enol-lactonase